MVCSASDRIRTHAGRLHKILNSAPEPLSHTTSALRHTILESEAFINIIDFSNLMPILDAGICLPNLLLILVFGRSEEGSNFLIISKEGN